MLYRSSSFILLVYFLQVLEHSVPFFWATGTRYVVLVFEDSCVDPGEWLLPFLFDFSSVKLTEECFQLFVLALFQAEHSALVREYLIELFLSGITSAVDACSCTEYLHRFLDTCCFSYLLYGVS